VLAGVCALEIRREGGAARFACGSKHRHTTYASHNTVLKKHMIHRTTSGQPCIGGVPFPQAFALFKQGEGKELQDSLVEAKTELKLIKAKRQVR